MLDAIRSATRGAHARLEARLDRQGTWTHERYAAFLRATLAVVGPLERAIDEHLQALVNLRHGGTYASDRLIRDLGALGAETTADMASGLPTIASRATAFGAAYVVEGSLLGGRFIAAALQATLGVGDDQLSYLRPVRRAGSWRDFTDQLNTFGESNPHEWTSMTTTAALTFQAFEGAFVREGVFDVDAENTETSGACPTASTSASPAVMPSIA